MDSIPWVRCVSGNVWLCQKLLWAIGPKNGRPSGQTATNQKTEVIQNYLGIWGRYDPIESGPSEPKNGGYIGVA